MRWDESLDALTFTPEGLDATCFVHRLAFRALLRGQATPESCTAFFAASRAAFDAAAAAKMRGRRLPPGTRLHLTSRDVARWLTKPPAPSSIPG